MNPEDSDITEPTPEELVKIIDEAVKNFRGNSERLKSAIGMLMLTRSFGWKPIFLLHSRATIKDYEKILGVDIRKIFKPVGPLAQKSVGWTIAEKLSNFWKAVKGEYPDIKTKSTELK